MRIKDGTWPLPREPGDVQAKARTSFPSIHNLDVDLRALYQLAQTCTPFSNATMYSSAKYRLLVLQ